MTIEHPYHVGVNMLCNNVESNKLFAKVVPVTVKDVYTTQCRTSKLFLTIQWEDAPAAMYRKVLVISLTDNDDPFFLYNLHLSEEDFQMLKVSQGLLVDFAAFPQKFIDLIEVCLLEEGKAHPKFLLMLSINEKLGNVASPSQLDIVETNPFKHLTHLSLKLIAATESAVKQYLATCFKSLKEEKLFLQNKLSFLEQDFKEKLSKCQETLSSKAQELDIVRKELSAELSVKESMHAKELQEERAKFLNKQREEENRLEKEMREKEHSLRKQIQQLETRVTCLDSLNKELQDKNYKHENAVRELRSRVLALEEENRLAKESLQNFKQQKELLHSEVRDKKSQIIQQRDKIEELEHELGSKKQVILRLQEQIESVQKQKRPLETELDAIKVQLEMSEKTQQSLKDDISKANEIILKLQQEVKTGHEKLKSRNKLSAKQEQAILEKDKIIERLKKDLTEMKFELDAENKEVKNLSDTVTSLQEKIKTLDKELKTRDNVIKWLNRQLTDRCVVPQYTPPANLLPSPNAEKQSYKSDQSTIPTPKNSPVMLGTTANTACKLPYTRDSILDKTCSPQVHFQAVETATDSAYSTSPSYTNQGIHGQNLNARPANLEIDSAALSAAFGSGDHNTLKHSTAKKQSTRGRSTKIPPRKP